MGSGSAKGAVTTPSDGRKQVPVWLLVLCAAVLTVLAAGAAMFVRVLMDRAPDGTKETLYQIAAQQIVLATVGTLIVATAVWSCFHILFLRTRISLLRSLLVFGLLILVGVIISVPSRLRAVAIYHNSFRVQAAAWGNDAAMRFRRLNHGVHVRLSAVYAEQVSWSEINADNVEQELTNRKQSISILENHRRQLSRESLGAARRLPEGPSQWRTRTRENFEAHLELGRTTFDLEQQLIEMEARLLTLLSDHKGEWVNSDGAFSFEDPAVAQRFDDLTAAREELKQRGLQAAQAWSDFEAPARQAGSAQPPPQ